jgi:hypothetical protein
MLAARSAYHLRMVRGARALTANYHAYFLKNAHSSCVALA